MKINTFQFSENSWSVTQKMCENVNTVAGSGSIYHQKRAQNAGAAGLKAGPTSVNSEMSSTDYNSILFIICHKKSV